MIRSVRFGPVRIGDASIMTKPEANPFVEEDPARFDRRPWGSYTVLEEGSNYKVKRIEVLPGKRLSYQKHSKRSEHWVMIQGTGRITLDDEDIVLKPGQAIDVPVGTAHRIENIGDVMLAFIEVQLGAYLGEDDIVRLHDDFGRVEQ
jgi:mannose-6-phosphate isomerase-like protein (cupin superfamily)